MSWQEGLRALAVWRDRTRSQPFGAGRVAVLGPGDAPLPPQFLGESYDYRGVASLDEVKPLAGQPLPLGHAFDVHRGGIFEIGLPLIALQRHAAILGPTGSGKTTSILIPWIESALRHGCSVVAMDVKGDLVTHLRQRLAHRGSIGVRQRIWDYRKPADSLSWNWLADIVSDELASGAATALLGEDEKTAKGDPYFIRRDYGTLRGLLRFATAVRDPRGLTVADLLDLLKDQRTLAGLLQRNHRAPGRDSLEFAASRAPSDYARAIDGTVHILNELNTASFRAVTSRGDLNLDTILDGPGLLVVGAPPTQDRLGQASASLFLNMIMGRIYRRYQSNSPHHPVMIFADEAPRLLGRFDFEQAMSISRDAGVGLTLAAQDLGQFPDENKRSAIFANCATLVIMPGVTPTTAEYVGKQLGTRQSSRFTITDQGGSSGLSRGVVQENVPVLGPTEIMYQPFGGRVALVHLRLGDMGITRKPILTDLSVC